MQINTDAGMAMTAKILFDSRQQVMQVQAAPPPASAPAAEHADVILSLSAAAQSLTVAG